MNTKQLITQALKESREGEGTLSLKDISDILKEVLKPEEVQVVAINLLNKDVIEQI